jgi:hypothetical protein
VILLVLTLVKFNILSRQLTLSILDTLPTAYAITYLHFKIQVNLMVLVKLIDGGKFITVLNTFKLEETR